MLPQSERVTEISRHRSAIVQPHDVVVDEEGQRIEVMSPPRVGVDGRIWIRARPLGQAYVLEAYYLAPSGKYRRGQFV